MILFIHLSYSPGACSGADQSRIPFSTPVTALTGMETAVPAFQKASSAGT